MNSAQVVAAPVAGTPLAYGIGLAVLAMVVLPVTTTWVGSLVTVAHEGGHIALPALTGWAAIDGSPNVQSALAVGLVWVMLLGGMLSLVSLGSGGDESDPAQLAKASWIPGIIWIVLFWAVSLACTWSGARLLLGF